MTFAAHIYVSLMTTLGIVLAFLLKKISQNSIRKKHTQWSSDYLGSSETGGGWWSKFIFLTC